MHYSVLLNIKVNVIGLLNALMIKTPLISSKSHESWKPIVVLYAVDAPMEERLFTRGLVNTLKSAGLEGQIWFDWDEVSFNTDRRSLSR